MPFTFTFSTTVKDGTDAVSGNVASITSDARAGYDGVIAPVTETEIDMVFKQTEVKALVLEATGALDLNINHAAADTPDQTITLAANSPVLWKVGDLYTMPITHDVTKIYAKNAGSTAATLKIRVLREATP